MLVRLQPEGRTGCWLLAQSDKDVAAYQPTEVAPAVVANAVEALPSVVASVMGHRHP